MRNSGFYPWDDWKDMEILTVMKIFGRPDLRKIIYKTHDGKTVERLISKKYANEEQLLMFND